MLSWKSCTQFQHKEDSRRGLPGPHDQIGDTQEELPVTTSSVCSKQIGDREGHMSCCLSVIPHTLPSSTDSTSTYLLVCGGYCADDGESADMIIGREVHTLYRGEGAPTSLGGSDKRIEDSEILSEWYLLGRPLTGDYQGKGIYEYIPPTSESDLPIDSSFLLERDGASLISIPINIPVFLSHTTSLQNGGTVDRSSVEGDDYINNKADVQYKLLLDGAAVGFGGLNSETEATSDLFAVWLVDSGKPEEYPQKHICESTETAETTRGEQHNSPFPHHPHVRAVGKLLSCQPRLDGNNFLAPSARYRHSCTRPVYSQECDSSSGAMRSPIQFRLYVFGGEDADGKVLSDIWCLQGCAILDMLPIQHKGASTSTADAAAAVVPTVRFECLQWGLVQPHVSPSAGPTPRSLSCIVGVSFTVNGIKGNDEIQSSYTGLTTRIDCLVIYGGSVYDTSTCCGVSANNDMWLVEVTDEKEAGRVAGENAEVLQSMEEGKDGALLQLRANYYFVDFPHLPKVNGHAGLITDCHLIRSPYRTEGAVMANTAVGKLLQEVSLPIAHEGIGASQHSLTSDSILSFSALFYGGKEFDTGSDDFHWVTFESSLRKVSYYLDIPKISNQSPFSCKYQCIQCPFYTLPFDSQSIISYQEGELVSFSRIVTQTKTSVDVPSMGVASNPSKQAMSLMPDSGIHAPHDLTHRCPYSTYVQYDGNTLQEDPTGGTGIGVWPHWRYMCTMAVADINRMPPRVWSDSDGDDVGGAEVARKLPVFLVGGQCRHTDPNTPVYQLMVL